jgi:hypothetical protein
MKTAVVLGLLAALAHGAPAAPLQRAQKKGPMTDCTQTVGPAQAGELADILQNAPDGAVICLQPGTYPVRAVLKRSITLRGQGAPGAVVLDGGGQGSVLRISAKAQAVHIERLTIANGSAVMAGGGIDGGPAGALTLTEVVLRGNQADGETPGAAMALTRGQATLLRCRVQGNRGQAAVFLGGAAQVRMVQTLLSDHEGPGATVRLTEAARLELDHVTLVAKGHGLQLGGTVAARPRVQIHDSIIAAKVAIQNGPAMAGEVTIERSVVSGERANVGEREGVRSGDPRFAGSGAEPYRPGKGSPALGLARPGDGPDLAGAPAGTCAGALQAAP